jgi:hypothetical protein
VEVSEAGFDFTGPYSLHLQRLTAAQRCSGSITCDAALSTTISNSADTDLHGFTGVAGEIVHISLGKEAGASSFFDPQWRLIAPDGTAATVCGTWSGVGSRECTIPAGGAYAVEVSEVGFDFTGPYSLHLQRLTAAQRCGGSITCGVAVQSAISNSADTDLHGFTGVANEIVHIGLAKGVGASSFFNPQWRLIAPDGTAAAVCGTWTGVGGFDCTLPSGGAYAVEVSEVGFDFTGPYVLTISGNGCTNNLPNLRVSTLAGKAVAGAGLAYSAKDTTLNAGTAPAPVSATKFFISLDATWDAGDTPLVPIAGRSVPTLAPGASSVGTTMVTIPAGTPPSRRYLIAYADGGSTVTESNETDNTKVKAIFVGPDLRVPTLTGPASATRGQTISVSDTTTNVGGAATIAATTTRIYLSKNTKVDAMDVPLGPGRSIPLLPAGAANTLATNVTIPSGTLPGAYYLVARADDGGVEAESRETNNTKALAITIN